MILITRFLLVATSALTAVFTSAPASAGGPDNPIDRYLQRASKKDRLAFLPADELTFLRRATLDLTGRLPTPDETRAFLEEDSLTKRFDLVDRLLAAEHEPEAVYLASGGLTWCDAWLDDLARRRPAHVLIWFDHDLSGNSSPTHHDAWIAAWRKEMQRRRDANPRLAERPFPAPPQPRGPKLANELLARGVCASVYRWPASAPRGADLGWALLQEYAYAA